MNGHTLRKLPNINSNQIALNNFNLSGSFLNLINDPEIYEINGVLSKADARSRCLPKAIK